MKQIFVIGSGMPIVDTPLGREAQDRYLIYALSVVSDRALPDVRDGLKPVQRRILYAMAHNLGLKPSGHFRKSAAVVGEVLANYHPHGDIACYEAMVRLAQDFSLRYPLVQGQGNFGSMDGDGPAAYRYTEVRLRELALEVLGEIDQDTVPFRDNFDALRQEPVVLASRVPNLLINGASGIAVGMATSIPPHNLRDVVKALLALSEDPQITTAKLVTLIKGPDFPTECLVLNSRAELISIYESGRGLVRMRSEWELEEQARGRRAIIVKSIPYALNKAQLVERIADLIRERKVPQLVDVRDESTAKVRVVLELASGADPEVAMTFLFKHTGLESNFAVNLTALVPAGAAACRPEQLSLRALLQHFLDFRHEIVERRLRFEKKNLQERIHILQGFATIFADLETALKIVRQSEGRADAAQRLRRHFKLSEEQALAVVDLRIYQLSRTDINKIRAELMKAEQRLAAIEKILKSKKEVTKLVWQDLEEVARRYGDNRRSRIVKDHVEVELRESDYIVEEEVFAIVTRDGWLKRIRRNNELSATRLREGDAIAEAHSLSTHDAVAFFTNRGALFVVKVTDFPASSGYGVPIQRLLKFRDGEAVAASYGVRSGETGPGAAVARDLREGQNLILVSRQALGFVLELSGLAAIKRSGKRAMKLKAGDELVAVCPHRRNLALFSAQGCALAIAAKEIPVRAEAAVGVALMGLRAGDHVAAAVAFDRSAEFMLEFKDGPTQACSSAEILAGRRALKGRKVIKAGEKASEKAREIARVFEVQQRHEQIKLL